MDRRHFVAAVTALALILIFAETPVAQTLTPAQVARMSSAYLRLDGIPGDSLTDRHRGEIDIDTFSWAQNRAASGMSGGGAAGRASMGTFHFTTYLGQASPRLFQACTTGQVIRSAVLSVSVPNHEYLYWRLWDVTVREYRTVHDTKKDHRPREEFSLDFGRIEIEYRPVAHTGAPMQPVRSGWDVRANRPF
jgi:type VI secretion system secreted protein Hcp